MTIEKPVEETGSAWTPRPAWGPRWGGAAPQRTAEPDGLAELVRALREHRFRVAAVALASLAAGLAYLALAPPRYQSNVLIQVEGPSRAGPLLGEPAGAAGERPDLEPELELLRSRSLLREVVDELGLAVEAAPRRLPLVGAALARRYAGEEPAAPPRGLGRFGWGGERIRVERLEVDEPLLGRPLRLVALEGGRYRLLRPDGTPWLEGQVGEAAHADGPRRPELVVSELVARPGTEFILRRRRAEDAVGALQELLRVSEKTRRSGVIAVTLEGPDPKRAAAVLDCLARHYLSRGQARLAAEAGQALQIVEAQLPLRKAKVDQAEGALKAFQQGKRAASVAVEGQSVVAQSTELDRELVLLEQQQAELRHRYTDSHPAVAEVAAKLRGLYARRAQLAQREKELPRTELVVARLTRELTTATDQYTQLLGEAERLRMLKAAVVSRATVLDSALVPALPFSPRPRPVLGLATLLGLAVGVGTAFAKRASGRRAAGAEELERKTGLPVLAAVPRSRAQGKLSSRWRPQASLRLLASLEPGDAAVDELWALRAGLEPALVGRPTGVVVAVLGPGPQVGKSFLCANLAQVLAASGRRVLLVDADLRRGALHRYFAAARQPGLSDVVLGAVPLDGALIRARGVDLLRAGTQRGEPAELLAGAAFETLLAQLAGRYEVVLVDTAPVLAVADALPVARLADVNLLVVREGMDPEREALEALQRLERGGARVEGLVLNAVRAPRDRYARYRAGARPGSLGVEG
ncbi:MAG TPA: GNVR domain-containing protein [Myxococcales bacterium]|jgi:tyrosine-protein kinase Etk/Wzc